MSVEVGLLGVIAVKVAIDVVILLVMNSQIENIIVVISPWGFALLIKHSFYSVSKILKLLWKCNIRDWCIQQILHSWYISFIRISGESKKILNHFWQASLFVCNVELFPVWKVVCEALFPAHAEPFLVKLSDVSTLHLGIRHFNCRTSVAALVDDCIIGYGRLYLAAYYSDNIFCCRNSSFANGVCGLLFCWCGDWCDF